MFQMGKMYLFQEPCKRQGVCVCLCVGTWVGAEDEAMNKINCLFVGSWLHSAPSCFGCFFPCFLALTSCKGCSFACRHSTTGSKPGRQKDGSSAPLLEKGWSLAKGELKDC